MKWTIVGHHKVMLVTPEGESCVCLTHPPPQLVFLHSLSLFIPVVPHWWSKSWAWVHSEQTASASGMYQAWEKKKKKHTLFWSILNLRHRAFILKCHFLLLSGWLTDSSIRTANYLNHMAKCWSMTLNIFNCVDLNLMTKKKYGPYGWTSWEPLLYTTSVFTLIST